MKTYTIKPLEWGKTHKGYKAGNFEVFQISGNNAYMWVYYEKDGYNLQYDKTDTIEAAKAKAQELHEAELMKHLQECHSLSHGDANLSVSTPLEAGSAQNGVDTP